MIAAHTSVLYCNPFCNYRDDPSLETSTQSQAWVLIVLMGWLSLASPRVWLSSTVLARAQQRRQSLALASLTVLLLPKLVLISYYTFGLCLCWISSHWLQNAAEVLELVYSFSSGTKALVSPVRLVPLQLLLGFSANPSPWSIPSCTAHSAEDDMPHAPSHLPCSLLMGLCQQCSRSQPVSMYYISFLWSTRPVTLKNSILADLCGTALLKPYSTGCSLIYPCLYIDHSVIRPRIFLDSIFRLPNLSRTVMLLNPGQSLSSKSSDTSLLCHPISNTWWKTGRLFQPVSYVPWGKAPKAVLREYISAVQVPLCCLYCDPQPSSWCQAETMSS